MDMGSMSMGGMAMAHHPASHRASCHGVMSHRATVPPLLVSWQARTPCRERQPGRAQRQDEGIG